MRKPRKRTKLSHKIQEKIYESWTNHAIAGGYFDNIRISKTIKKILNEELHGNYDECLINKYITHFRKIYYDFQNVRWYRNLLR